ncbi:ABC transporter permease [Streptomyces sp. NPDC050546]|uniref:ABC transporter permease n=1 Tax=Streptomyces sp. NPDC050546 TaxID=3365628 RepID=UPI00379718C7
MNMAQELVAGATTAPPVDPGRLASGRRSRIRLLLRSPLPLTAAIVLVTIVLVSLIAPAFVSDTAQRQDLTQRLSPPFHLSDGFAFVLGGDTLGRPMLYQLFVATKTSLFIAAISVALSAIVGSAIGLISGYTGGWVDALIMRLSDIIHTLPSLLLALVILYVLSPSITNLIVVLALTRLPIYMRVARAQALEIRERVFVEASKALGSRPWRIMLRDIRPMVAPTVMTVAMLEVANVILQAAGLSFLGVGLQRPDVDLGIMVASGREYLSEAWFVTFFPGLLVVIIALAANILSNWLRAVDDPGQSALFVSRTSLREEESR